MTTVLPLRCRSGIVRVTIILAISCCFASNLSAGVSQFLTPGIGNMGAVTGGVTPLGGGQYRYDYTLQNDVNSLDPINGFLLPFFDDVDTALVNNTLTTPPGWAAALATTGTSSWSYNPIDDPLSGTYGIDPSSFVNPPYVLHFFVPGIVDPCGPGGYACLPSADVGIDPNAVSLLTAEVFPGNSLGGFSYVSDYGSGDAPMNIEFSGGIIITDPPIPVTPGHPAFAGVPEPSTLVLTAVCLLALGMRRRRRRR